MKSQYGFTLMTISEFESWIVQQKVTRRITVIQEHHTWSPCYKQFNGSNHLHLQKNMRDYHVNSAGYADIAQNFTVFPDGMICTGRSMNVAPAGCRGANTNGICIENLGNFDVGGDKMNAAQKDVIVRMAAALLKKFKLSPETGITYHAWWTDSGSPLGTYIAGRSCKTCPGTAFFGGNTRASYDKNLKPLIVKAMNGTYNVPVKEEKEVTQEQFNKMMDTYLAGLAKQQPSSWSETARKWAEGIGLIKGDDKGNKNYKSFCTREQMVQFLYRFKDMK